MMILIAFVVLLLLLLLLLLLKLCIVLGWAVPVLCSDWLCSVLSVSLLNRLVKDRTRVPANIRNTAVDC